MTRIAAVSSPRAAFAIAALFMASGCTSFPLFELGGAVLSYEAPAGIFALEAPASAVAGQPFVVKAWVALERSDKGWQEISPDTFRATVLDSVKQITIAGQVMVMKPPAGQKSPADKNVSIAETVDITVTAPAGTYALTMGQFPDKIPTDLYFRGYPWSPDGVIVREVPRPHPGQTITVEPAPAPSPVVPPGTVTVARGRSGS